jgi:hypothetical protein
MGFAIATIVAGAQARPLGGMSISPMAKSATCPGHCKSVYLTFSHLKNAGFVRGVEQISIG